MTVALSDSPVDFYVAMAESAFGMPSSFKPPVGIHDVGVRDDDDPSDPEGARTASVVARLQQDHPEFFRSKAYGANVTHRPLSPAARRAGRLRELAGGRRQSY